LRTPTVSAILDSAAWWCAVQGSSGRRRWE